MIFPSENFDTANSGGTSLPDLVERLCHGELAGADAERLERLVIADASARRYYARYLNLHANLPWVVGSADAAAEGSAEAAPANRSSYLGFLADAVRGIPGGEFVVGGLVLLAVAGAVWGVIHFTRGNRASGERQMLAHHHAPRSTGPSIGSLATDNRTRWAAKPSAVNATVVIGRRYELAAGAVEIKLKRGTHVVVEGPATWRFDSDQRLQLDSGKLLAYVPLMGLGFTVVTPTAEVIDLGTEFGVTVARDGKTEVHVMKGKVELKQARGGGPAASGGMELAAGMAVRMESRGAGFSPIALDRRGFASALLKLAAEPGAIGASAVHDSNDIQNGTITFQDGLYGYSGTADTFISAGQGQGPDDNFGNSDLLPVYEREVVLNNFKRILIRFDFTSLPPGTRIAAARLTLYQKHSGGNQEVTNSLYVVAPANAAWTEGTGTGQPNLPTGATWNNSSGSGTPWLGGPGLVAGIDYAAAPVATANTPNDIGAPMTFVLGAAGVAAIQDWVDDPANNSGFLIRQPDFSFSVDHFWSRSAPDTTLRPALVLTVIAP